MADERGEANFWYAATPATRLIAAIDGMGAHEYGRWTRLKEIASQSRTRWIISDQDEDLRRALWFGHVGHLRRWFKRLIESGLLYVTEEGCYILDQRSAFPHEGVRVGSTPYPDCPNLEQSIRNIQALAAAGSESKATYQGIVPPRARKALERGWETHLGRLAASGLPVPDEKADRKAYALTREEFARSFVPWYTAEADRIGPGKRVNLLDFYANVGEVTPPETVVTPTAPVTNAQSHAESLSQPMSQTATYTADLSEESSFEIQKETTDTETGPEQAECHAAQKSPRDKFFEDMDGMVDGPRDIGADVSAAAALLCGWKVSPRETAIAFVQQHGVETCTLYANAMPGFLKEAKRRHKPIRRTAPFLLEAIRERYDLPVFVQAYVDRREARTLRRDLEEAEGAAPSDSSPEHEWVRLDHLFATLPSCDQAEIDNALVPHLPDRVIRPRFLAWLERREGEPPYVVREQLYAHRRRAVQSRLSNGKEQEP